MTRPKAQKAGSRLMVGRFKRKGMRNIYLTRSYDQDLYPVCIRDRLVLILVGLYM